MALVGNVQFGLRTGRMRPSPVEFIVRDGSEAGQRIPLPAAGFAIGSAGFATVDELDDTSAPFQVTAKRPTPFRLTEPPTSPPLAALDLGAARSGPRPVTFTSSAVAPTMVSGRLASGEVIEGRYRIIARIAAGGMGEVFKVEHLELGKPLALKVMLPGLIADTEFVNRFKIEAIAASRIGHPNIIDISDFGKMTDGRFFFVMEFLDGLTLSSLVHREGAQTPARVADLGLQVARALAAAHELHIVHRDLKPENVMVLQRPGNPDLAKVLDFGVARVQVDSQSIGKTAVGIVVGTPQYMSPEQATATVVDARSDIYSLGLILHELLTGQPTFTGETAPLVMVKQVTELPPALSAHVPEALSELISSMLEKNPADRPQLMKDVVEVLDGICNTQRANAPGGPPGRVLTPAKFSSRGPIATRAKDPEAGVMFAEPPSSLDPLLVGPFNGPALNDLKPVAALVAPKPKRRGSPLAPLAALLSIVVGSAAFFAVEQPWEPTTQARWLLHLNKPALALEVLGVEDAKTAPQRALALEALGKQDELAKLLEERCVAVVSGLDRVDRERLKVSFAGCAQ